jgi:hypothetical protein
LRREDGLNPTQGSPLAVEATLTHAATFAPAALWQQLDATSSRLSTSSHLPWDWSLKTCLKFTSPESFAWVTGARGAVAEGAAMAAAGAGAAAAPAASREERVARSLLSWSHPAHAHCRIHHRCVRPTLSPSRPSQPQHWCQLACIRLPLAHRPCNAWHEQSAHGEHLQML